MTSQSFPLKGLLPKDATQSSSFLKKYPKFNGSNVTVAILDTGVDPGAPGLQTTPDGEQKIVDIVDCTGSGDVVLSQKSVNPDGLSVEGISGRKLLLSPKWSNPSNEYRFGLVGAYDIFPDDLIKRIKKERKEKFDVEHQRLLNVAQNEFVNWKSKHPPSSVLNDDELEYQNELENRVASLKESMENYDDPGPVYDCVVFNDGKCWRAAIDIHESGDLRDATLYTDYKREYQYGTFNHNSSLNFSVNFYDDGEVLSIVTLAGSHGTHVAAITGAYHPDEPVLNGVAPGIRIVSLKIGDTRLGSMETGTGLSRALRCMIDNKCDLANMSYGEDSAIPNDGFWVNTLRDELINKHHVIFISSAGNAGPALSTVGAPGGSTSGVIGVGAYVTSEMVEAEYGLIESKVGDVPYTWSSRGPSLDGGKDVSIYAPGAAITSVPQYQLKNGQLMNGTSMSSPNACGCISLLVSGLKFEGIAFNPYRIKKAVENTSKDIKDALKVGFIQVEESYAHLKKNAAELDQDIEFQVKLPTMGGARGIYLRDSVSSDSEIYAQTSKFVQVPVSVSAIFRKGDEGQSPLKLSYEQRIALISTEPWVQCPDYLLMNSGGRDFQVSVDPRNLKPGLHYAEVQAIDTACPEKGPVFRLPVTVLKPSEIGKKDPEFNFKQIYAPGYIDRRFVIVPPGASWAKLKIKANGPSTPGRLVVHLYQAIPYIKHTLTEQQWYFSLLSDSPIPEKSFRVDGGTTMEVCSAQFWSSAGTYEIEFDFEFHGVSLGNAPLFLDGSKGYERLQIDAPIRQEDVSLSLSFDYLRKHLRPEKEGRICALKSRDILPNGKALFELVLGYNLKISNNNTELYIRKPIADGMLYESPFDSVLLMVSNVSKRTVEFQDITPGKIKLDKGEYQIRIQIRHCSEKILEKLKNMVISIEMKLQKTESVDLYKSQAALFKVSAKPLSKMVIKPSKSVLAYAQCNLDSPADASFGDQLIGSVGYGCKVDGWKDIVIYQLPPKPNSDNDEATKKIDAKKKFEDSIRDAKIAGLSTLDKTDDKEALLTSLLRDYPNSVEVLSAKLSFYASENIDSEESRAKAGDIIVSCADEVISMIDEAKLLQKLGSKPPAVENVDYKFEKKQMEAQKKYLADAYLRKAEAQLCMALLADESKKNGPLHSFSETWKKFWAYLDLKSSKHIYLAIARERILGHNASALKILNTFQKEQPSAKITAEPVSNFIGIFGKRACSKVSAMNEHQKLTTIREEIFKDLGWQVWSTYEAQWNRVRYQKEYSPF